MIFAGIALTVGTLTALLVAERRAFRPGIWAAKPLASTGFLLTACGAGALHTPYGRWVLAGQLCGFCGDVLLIPKSRRIFVMGLVSFLLGHLLLTYAFCTLQTGWSLASVALVALSGAAGAVHRWLWPHLPKSLRVPVALYIATITLMAAMACGTAFVPRGAYVLPGALLFYLSDLGVARQQFVHKAFVNKLVGLPPYYAAQLLLALSVQS